MVKHTIATKALSRFSQIFDGSFPSGSFVHSFGLEPHIILEKVSDIKELKEYLQRLIKYQYQKFDFVFAKKIYGYAKEERLDLLIKEDNKFFAMQNFYFAKASKDLGANYLKQINFDIQKEIIKKYFQSVVDEQSAGNEMAILSAYAYELDLEIELFLLLWCKKNIINISMACLKISRIQPTQIQQMLFEFDEALEVYIKNSVKHLNNFNPLFEEVIFEHNFLEPKMFMT